MKKLVQVYDNSKNVLEAARERVALIFNLFTNINISVSGGKDSTVLAHLIIAEAKKRNRQITMLYIDEEVVYEETVRQVEYLMLELAPELVTPAWFQVEFNSTNATSLNNTRFLTWERGKHLDWIRPKQSFSIKNYPWDRSNEIMRNPHMGLDFYDIIANYESTKTDTAFFVGLRARESMKRWRAVTNYPVNYKDTEIYWATPRGDNYTVYPLYDWTTEDIWKYIHENKLRYHNLYDRMFKKGYHIANMRVNSLLDENGYKALVDLPEFEPETFNRLVNRVNNVLFAQETAKSSKMFKSTILPKAYKSWITYRDFLISTHPVEADKDVLVKRFSKQLNNEYVARQQVRQLLHNDFENNVPIENIPDPREKLLAYYKEVL